VSRPRSLGSPCSLRRWPSSGGPFASVVSSRLRKRRDSRPGRLSPERMQYNRIVRERAPLH
jgi:hypothetical protein